MLSPDTSSARSISLTSLYIEGSQCLAQCPLQESQRGSLQALHLGSFAMLSWAEQVLIPWTAQRPLGQMVQGLIANPLTFLSLRIGQDTKLALSRTRCWLGFLLIHPAQADLSGCPYPAG